MQVVMSALGMIIRVLYLGYRCMAIILLHIRSSCYGRPMSEINALINC